MHGWHLLCMELHRSFPPHGVQAGTRIEPSMSVFSSQTCRGLSTIAHLGAQILLDSKVYCSCLASPLPHGEIVYGSDEVFCDGCIMRNVFSSDNILGISTISSRSTLFFKATILITAPILCCSIQ